MKSLINKINILKKSPVKKLVDLRLIEFKSAGKNKSKLFSELCYCLLTANFNALRAMKIQKEIGNKFLLFSEAKLASELKRLGHRFPNARAHYIFEAQKHANILNKKIKTLDEKQLREWLVENIKGLGWKESSHFLRNIGYCDCAIIDFHIIDVLEEYKLVKKPKGSLTKKTYHEIESRLRNLASKLKMNLSELDLYLWYLETGKVLK